MTVQLLESFTTDLLENKYLVCLYIISKNCCLYYSALNIRSTYLYCTLVVDEEHLVKLYGLVFLCGETVDVNLRAGLYFELLSGDFYDCVHFFIKLIKFQAVSVCSPGQIFVGSAAIVINWTANVAINCPKYKSFGKIYVCLCNTNVSETWIQPFLTTDM